MPNSASRPDRRSFLTSLGALSGFALFPKGGRVEAVPASLSQMSSPWDLSWLDTLKGKHKQVFDFGHANISDESHLGVVRNYLNAHEEVFGLEYPHVNTLIGIAYRAYPLNASDALWEKYPIGEMWKIKDPRTNAWAKRNIYTDPDQTDPKGPYTIQALVARGTAFWQCNNALGFVVETLAKASGRPVETVRAELLQGMMPGVHLVPAHTMLIGLAQEHGFTYESM